MLVFWFKRGRDGSLWIVCPSWTHDVSGTPIDKPNHSWHAGPVIRYKWIIIKLTAPAIGSAGGALRKTAVRRAKQLERGKES